MTRKNIFEKNPKKSVAILVLGLIFIMDVTAANLYKYFSGHSFYTEIRGVGKLFKHRTSSDIYHHDLKKMFYLEDARWGSQDYTIATDSLGFKSDKPGDTALVSEKKRILFIGDSFTEGIGIEYEDTFVGRIANTLSASDIEVLNAGVTSYSPIIYYRKIKYLLDHGLKFNELVVYIDISDIVDEALHYEMSPNNTVLGKGGHKKKRAFNINWMVKNNSIIAAFYFKLISAYNNKPRGKSEIRKRLGMWTIDEQLFRQYGAEGLKKSAYYMSQLHNILQANKIKLTIAVYPWPDQILNHDLNSIQVKFWRNWAKEKQVPLLNYFPCFIRQDEDIGHQRETVEKLFIQGDDHWNEKGHQLIAEKFLSARTGRDKNEICQ